MTLLPPGRAELREFRFPRLWLGLWWLGMALTVLTCAVPLPPVAWEFSYLDKVEHALGYAVLAGYAALLFRDREGWLRAGAALLLLGIGIELMQTLLPWRSGDLIDAFANSAGIGLGLLLAVTPLAKLLVVVERWLPGRRPP